MHKDSRQWNFQNVCMVLDRETMDAIRSIPIGNVGNPDRIVWPWSANGQYSVKSGSVSSSTREFMEIQRTAAPTSFVNLSVDNLFARWSPPRRGWFKVNSDAAWRKDTNRAGLGVMIRDSEGLLCDGSAENSLVLKAGVDGKHENHTWEILPILLEIRRVEAMFDAVEWSWIPCKKNRAAHAVTSFGIGAVHRVTWLDQPPSSLMGVLTFDGLPCPPFPVI
ncbi:hypothetical protein L3X38_032854 [Prunus dulcis]|uniref:RNase H type-1 domain-containing protein n=1 Tax=Prunus dulcis TaxID=3755 RepID=A0AAD4YVB9_PRUDU|nr:hypothetical protein L3X38_032854 [Prunus dulcis]